MYREGVFAHLTFELRAFFAVVVVDILVRCLAMWAANNTGGECFFGFCFNQLKRFIMFFLVFLQNFFIVFRRFFLLFGCSCNGSLVST